jgi:pimeloyl-ACP methyl ester carboxylesterase
MRIVEFGSGVPVIVIPGIQGRWEWMRPGIEALARQCRVITFSLLDERSCGGDFDERRGFACYVDQVREAIETAGVASAAVCGVSYGGVIAAAFAAAHPERVTSLVLVSALPPSWRADRRVRFYVKAPRLLSPLFCLASLRLYREFAAARRHHGQAVAAAVAHAWTALTHRFSPSRMARRVTLLDRARSGLVDAIRAVDVPTLVVTGEAALDRVVPVVMTRQYLAMWPHARAATIDRTGHLGIVTRPDEFAAVVGPFVIASSEQFQTRRATGRRVG